MIVSSASFRQVRPDPARAEPLSMEGVKGTRMEMLVGRAHGAPTFAMRHFVVDPGGHTPHHQHDYEHEVVILEGEADVVFDAATHRARAGDVLFIPANHMHQFRNAGHGTMRFLCLVPTSFDCGKPTPGS